jgi:dTDP-4-amino-4,6-dideoxygalactose transaminase
VTSPIPFNRPFLTGRELAYIAQAHERGQLAGDGAFTRSCSVWLETRTSTDRALLTHSCTAALEMAAILAEIQPGDEVIMPSFTFVSSANAFVARGAVPVFVDIRADTMNIDEALIEEAITPRTKAVLVVHYAGVACEMRAITEIAESHDLLVIEDAAHALLSTYHGRALGSIGDLGTLSFHETKNVISGEGGALLVNDARLADRADIVREKGTNRSLFFRGLVDKYTWVDVGSSYLPGEIIAAFLYAQMEEADAITSRRLALWERYHEALGPLEQSGRVRRPTVPDGCVHNGHMYYLMLPDLEARTTFIASLGRHDIQAVFHYVPLHTSPMGKRVGRVGTDLRHTTEASERLVRLPLWVGLEEHQDRVIEAIMHAAP